METVENETANRRVWTDEETKAFLKCYKVRELEMSQSRKKMLGYNHILDDLCFMGVLESPTTSNNLQSKMSSLIRAYQRALYIESKNGKGSSSFAFMKLMNDIFGTSSSSASESSKNISTSAQLTSARAPSTSTCAPSTSTCAPSTSTCAPSTSTRAPSTSTRALSTSTRAPSTLNIDVTSQEESEDTNKRIWKYEETRALINCYASREDESRHPKKSKNLFKNILEDLESMNVLKGPTTESNVYTKWNRLLNAYKMASDAEALTGRGSSTFMYMDEMDEIFSGRPIMANSHTVNLYGEEIQAIPFRPIQRKILPADENENDVDDMEVYFRSFSPVKEINLDEVVGCNFEIVENVAVSTAKTVEPRHVFPTLAVKNVAGSSTKNGIPTLALKNVAGSSTKSVTKNPISIRKTSTVIAEGNEFRSFLTEGETNKLAGYGFESIVLNESMDIENVAASTAKTIVPINRITTLALGNVSGPSAKNVRKTQISNRKTSTVTAAHNNVRSLLMEEMELSGNDNENVTVSTAKTVPRKSFSNPNPKSTGEALKSKKVPFSFRRTKTAKEIVQEKKELWEKEKLKKKDEARMKQISFMEEKKQQRHKERCQVMNKILEKM